MCIAFWLLCVCAVGDVGNFFLFLFSFSFMKYMTTFVNFYFISMNFLSLSLCLTAFFVLLIHKGKQNTLQCI